MHNLQVQTRREEQQAVDAVPMQPASIDIWDRKYRLKANDGTPVDGSIEETYTRVARALAEVEEEEKREFWFHRFGWALANGAIPAGRIVSNAGAGAHKPATSTINCTVSGTIPDSMDGILTMVREAGLTLKAGCGIGYEFSTLRPKGAYVSGAGAYTSGPLSFMDIYDKMCFTVSSAGGRRGAQMGTFDISHPDVIDFIRAKREDGRLRQFNLSCLITREFMEAVKADADWHLVFPASPVELEDPETQVVFRRVANPPANCTRDERGRVACKVYRTIKARRLWDVIMASTYDYAEPGFILIDRVNEMNNNWWCEEIRATNPCVTADTWVQTADGPRRVAELIGRRFEAVVDGVVHASGEEGFFRTAHKEVVRLATREGYALRLTADHRVRRVIRMTDRVLETEWIEAEALRPGDRVLLHRHRDLRWPGALGRHEGYLLGALVGAGALEEGGAVLSVWAGRKEANGPDGPGGAHALMIEVEQALRRLSPSDGSGGWQEVGGSGGWRLHSTALCDLAFGVGLRPGERAITPAMERASSDFYEGFLRGLFDADGTVLGVSGGAEPSVRLEGCDRLLLDAVQRMLLRLGIVSAIRHCPHADGAGRPRYVLVVSGGNLEVFATRVGFADGDKWIRLQSLLGRCRGRLERERFVATVEGLSPDGCEEVFDVQVPGIHTFDANGLHAHNCGEQPLPPYGACLLGSINLTRFVRDPFTDAASFDWERFREVVAVFTRMLDNVVEINGLPLERQREEIMRKRRHGMGFLGLGSALTMLRVRYGSRQAQEFTEQVAYEMARTGYRVGLELAEEKGPAPIMDEMVTVTEEMMRRRPEMARDGIAVGDEVPGRVLWARYSRYMQQLAASGDPEDAALVEALAERGCRFTHHSSIAPTGTISLSLANNASNGIEPSFAHHYARNVIREGKKSKEKVDVYSYELLAYRTLVDPDATPEGGLPDYFVSADTITPREHVDMQAAAQKWIDSSISKTANVPTDYPYEEFKEIYMYAYEKGLKGCTTFRFNPEVFQGVLVKEQDLANTTYRFTLEDGSTVECKGNEMVEYDGEVHSAANLFDALKEGYYGKF
ncbi:MAG: ribonucleoside-diphosphate reductase [Zetaproteobacteria bacterium]|nr:MAG: ribonucleoside-diphosphate reductase [Zetaproteobacteria bacterium]